MDGLRYKPFELVVRHRKHGKFNRHSQGCQDHGEAEKCSTGLPRIWSHEIIPIVHSASLVRARFEINWYTNAFEGIHASGRQRRRSE